LIQVFTLKENVQTENVQKENIMNHHMNQKKMPIYDK